MNLFGGAPPPWLRPTHRWPRRPSGLRNVPRPRLSPHESARSPNRRVGFAPPWNTGPAAPRGRLRSGARRRNFIPPGINRNRRGAAPETSSARFGRRSAHKADAGRFEHPVSTGTSGPESASRLGAEPAPAWWAEPRRSNPVWPEGSRCRNGMSETASVGRAGWPRPRPRIPLEEPCSRGSGGMASLEVRTTGFGWWCSVQRMSPPSIARPASAGTAGSQRDVSPLNICPLGFGRFGADGMCPASRSGLPSGRTTLSTARAGVSRRQALREEPRLRPTFGCRRRGPARTFGSGGSRDLPGTCASPPPRWFAAGREDALCGRFA